MNGRTGAAQVYSKTSCKEDDDMTEKLQIYKCEVCGNIVEMLHAGAGELVCCGQPMKLYLEKISSRCSMPGPANWSAAASP